MVNPNWWRVPAIVVALLCASAAPSGGYLLPDTGQTACYQAAFPYGEIPCAGSGQDGAYPRHPMSYTDMGNGTVTDNNTGLIWQQEDDGALHNWYRAS